MILSAQCNNDHVDKRLITSYSIETRTEHERDLVEKEFKLLLGKLGMQKALAAEVHAAGFHGQGETTVRWTSKTSPYSITITRGSYPKYLSSDIAWDFRGSKQDWQKFEQELQGFQKKVVEWFKKRPELLHKESTYWDGSM